MKITICLQNLLSVAEINKENNICRDFWIISFRFIDNTMNLTQIVKRRLCERWVTSSALGRDIKTKLSTETIRLTYLRTHQRVLANCCCSRIYYDPSSSSKIIINIVPEMLTGLLKLPKLYLCCWANEPIKMGTAYTGQH